MRFFGFVLFAVCLLAITLASPAKNNQKQTPTCARDCGDAYDPVCAKAKDSTKERLITFGSDCVLANYNCEHANDQFEVKAKGECGGNVSVRLS